MKAAGTVITDQQLNAMLAAMVGSFRAGDIVAAAEASGVPKGGVAKAAAARLLQDQRKANKIRRIGFSLCWHPVKPEPVGYEDGFIGPPIYSEHVAISNLMRSLTRFTINQYLALDYLESKSPTYLCPAQVGWAISMQLGRKRFVEVRDRALGVKSCQGLVKLGFAVQNEAGFFANAAIPEWPQGDSV